MPASVIDRLQSKGYRYNPADGVTLVAYDKRNEAMERISRNAHRLRGQTFMGTAGTPLPPLGRNDSLEQLLVRLGVIPIVALPNATSLTGTMQAWSGRRPATSENIAVTGATAGTSFVAGDPAKSVAFSAGGNAQALTATDSVDTQAKGRGLINILP